MRLSGVDKAARRERKQEVATQGRKDRISRNNKNK